MWPSWWGDRVVWLADGLHSGAQVPSPSPGPEIRHPCRRLPTSSRALKYFIKGSWVLTGERCICPWSSPDCRLFANLEETVPDTSVVPPPPHTPEFACISFLPPLSSPEEDLPWQGPEEKEGKDCRKASCHFVGTLEPFLNLAAKVRADILQGPLKVQSLPPTRSAHKAPPGLG